MKQKYDFSKEWPKMKKQLMEFSKEAVEVVKKGEEELVRLSQAGKLRVDATTIGLKKEHLFYLIGKEYARTAPEKIENTKLKKLFAELDTLDRQLRVIKRTMKQGTKKK